MREIVSFYKKMLRGYIDRDIEVTIELLNVSDLRKIPRYQRSVVESQLEKMRRKFNPFSVGLLAVNYRDNQPIPWLMDGNHRSVILREQKIEVWPCIVTHGLTEREEADVWIDLNKNRGQARTFEVLKSALIAKEPEAINIALAVHRQGMRFRFDNKDLNGLTLHSILPLKNAYDLGVLDRVLWIVRQLWPTDVNAVKGKMLNGLVTFLGNKEVKEKIQDLAPLVETIKNSLDGSPMEIMRRGAARCAIVSNGVAQELKIYWNKHRSGKSRIQHDFYARKYRNRKDPEEE